MGDEKYRFESIKISKLKFWNENVRFNSNCADDQKIVKSILNLTSGTTKFNNLLKDVLKSGYVKETLIVFQNDSNEYIVLDGNRRLALFKIKKYPLLIEEYNIKFEDIKSLDSLKIDSLDCLVYKDIDLAYNHVENRHQGELGGVGIVNWSPQGKDRMNSLRGKSLSVGTEIIKAFKESNLEEYSFVKENIKNASTITRIFKASPVVQKFHHVNSTHYNFNNKAQLDKANEILKHFYEIYPNGEVEHVMNINKTEELFNHIEPIDMSLVDHDIQLSFDDNIKLPDKPNAKKERNSYKSEIYNFFRWQNNGINIPNKTFNYHYTSISSLKLNSKNNSHLNKYLTSLSPFFYRLLIEISLEVFTEDFNKNKTQIAIATCPFFQNKSLSHL